jgi:hypothetical protein
MQRPQIPIFLGALVLLASSHAFGQLSCPNAKGFQQPHQIGGYAVQVSLGSKGSSTDQCHGSVARPGASPTVFAGGWSMWLDNISGTDINRDGAPDTVFTTYTGGKSCCFDYTIVSLGKSPALLRKIHNQEQLHFEKQNDGSVIIRAGDGAFDLFMLPHDKSVVPDVFFKFQGTELKNVSGEFPQGYDDKIARARSELTPAALEKFRASDIHKSMYTDQLETVRQVLTIVLNYLYSGREEQGWKALEELWPSGDQDRVRSLIIERRNRGLLAQLNP